METWISFAGVAVSGVTIDINNVPKSNDISLEFADGPDAVLKCNLVSSAETFAQISDEGLCLKESTAEGNSCEDYLHNFGLQQSSHLTQTERTGGETLSANPSAQKGGHWFLVFWSCKSLPPEKWS